MSGGNGPNALWPTIELFTDRGLKLVRIEAQRRGKGFRSGIVIRGGDIAFCHGDGCRLSLGAQGAYLTRRLGESCQFVHYFDLVGASVICAISL